MNNHCPKEKWEAVDAEIAKDLTRHKVSGSCFLWEKSTCPDCGTYNWIDMMVNIEACKCHKCNSIFWISEKRYDDYKLTLVMAQVFDLEAKEPEDIFNGMENPD